jgi:hypothetical protein
MRIILNNHISVNNLLCGIMWFILWSIYVALCELYHYFIHYIIGYGWSLRSQPYVRPAHIILLFILWHYVVHIIIYFCGIVWFILWYCIMVHIMVLYYGIILVISLYNWICMIASLSSICSSRSHHIIIYFCGIVWFILWYCIMVHIMALYGSYYGIVLWYYISHIIIQLDMYDRFALIHMFVPLTSYYYLYRGSHCGIMWLILSFILWHCVVYYSYHYFIYYIIGYGWSLRSHPYVRPAHNI